MENKEKDKKNTNLLLISILIILLILGSIFLIRRYYRMGYKSTNILPKLTLDLYDIDAFMQYDY
jgi:hypothetical protein